MKKKTQTNIFPRTILSFFLSFFHAPWVSLNHASNKQFVSYFLGKPRTPHPALSRNSFLRFRTTVAALVTFAPFFSLKCCTVGGCQSFLQFAFPSMNILLADALNRVGVHLRSINRYHEAFQAHSEAFLLVKGWLVQRRMGVQLCTTCSQPTRPTPQQTPHHSLLLRPQHRPCRVWQHVCMPRALQTGVRSWPTMFCTSRRR